MAGELCGVGSAAGVRPAQDARTSAAWWSNEGGKPHQTAWLEPGWTAEADRAAETVVFRRRGGGAVPAIVAEGPSVEDKPERKMSKAIAFGAAAAVAGLGAVLLRALRRR